MSDQLQDLRLSKLVELVLEVADGNYAARVEPSDRGDAIDAVAVGLNLVAESLELERERRRRAEALLRDEVHAYEQAPAMFLSVEMNNFEIVKCNETLAEALGVPKVALLNRRLLGFFPPEERPAGESALRAIAEERIPEQTTFHLVSQEQTSIPVLLSGTRADPAGARLRLILRDVSRERSLEAQLRQAQKLEAVGRLASGVAHDFNNILAVVLGSSALLKRTLPDDHRGLREIAAIVSAAENGSGLTRQLLALSKPIPEQEVPSADLNRLVRDAEPLVRRSLGPANELVLDLVADELIVRVEPSELVQVLLNLTVNARDAMPDGGCLTLRTAMDSSRGGAARAKLEVIDTGQGMEADLLEQVLEPFFTTKESSGGSGLGLAVCLRIVKQWGGELKILSETGAGSRVCVELPIFAGAVANPQHAARGRAPFGAGRRVLVIDDDPLVRSVLVNTLEEDGYEVLSASGLGPAVELAEAVGELDVAVTDVVMPEGSGVDLANALWETRPGLGVVFVSGYTGDIIDAALLERRNVRFLGKPFDADDLLALVSELSSD